MKSMMAHQPEELYPQFAAALNASDVAAIMALFDPEGQTIPLPGQPPVAGMDALRAVWEQCVALKPHIEYDNTSVMQADGVALLRSQWRISGMLPDGNRTEFMGKGVQVARRQADGSWRFLIDNPWAGAE
ncbi:MAG: SgcJ/EcaC family oxidoreductase [Caldilineaceae bacterium]